MHALEDFDARMLARVDFHVLGIGGILVACIHGEPGVLGLCLALQYGLCDGSCIAHDGGEAPLLRLLVLRHERNFRCNSQS